MLGRGHRIGKKKNFADSPQVMKSPLKKKLKSKDVKKNVRLAETEKGRIAKKKVCCMNNI